MPYYVEGEWPPTLGKGGFKKVLKKIGRGIKSIIPGGKGGGDGADAAAEAAEHCPPGSHTVEGLSMIGCGNKPCEDCGTVGEACPEGICPYTGEPPVKDYTPLYWTLGIGAGILVLLAKPWQTKRRSNPRRRRRYA